MRFFLILFSLFFLIACSVKPNEEPETPADEPFISSEVNVVDSSQNPITTAYTFEVFETANSGWGYKIFENGTLLINQPHIPAIAGNKGFSSKEKAEITVKFAILKMEQGLVPPTISPEELDSLGVLD